MVTTNGGIIVIAGNLGNNGMAANPGWISKLLSSLWHPFKMWKTPNLFSNQEISRFGDCNDCDIVNDDRDYVDDAQEMHEVLNQLFQVF